LNLRPEPQGQGALRCTLPQADRSLALTGPSFGHSRR